MGLFSASTLVHVRQGQTHYAVEFCEGKDMSEKVMCASADTQDVRLWNSGNDSVFLEVNCGGCADAVLPCWVVNDCERWMEIDASTFAVDYPIPKIVLAKLGREAEKRRRDRMGRVSHDRS